MQLLLRPLYQWYFRHSYQPRPLEEVMTDCPPALPPACRLDSVAWLATDLPVCVSTCLQMIATHFGIDRPRPLIDFLMGFTYGAGDLPGLDYLPAGHDPEIGFLEAAPYLGLQRYYWTTNDPVLFLAAIRYHLAGGRPVRLPVDMGRLYEVDQAIPHSIVVIGYDRDNFEYYEPVTREPATCRPDPDQAGQKGRPGCLISSKRLPAAVAGQAHLFHYPWRYALSVFEPGPLATDWRPLWLRNGQNLIGGRQLGMSWGAQATERLAAQIKKQGPAYPFDRLGLAFELGAVGRVDNAHFLWAWAVNPAVDQAADLFDKAACCYREGLALLALKTVKPTQALALAGCLREAAVAERAAGQLFLQTADLSPAPAWSPP